MRFSPLGMILLHVLFATPSCKPRKSSHVKVQGYFALQAGSLMPGVVGLQEADQGDEDDIFCTGTAVSDSTVITAAHCTTPILASKKPVKQGQMVLGQPICVETAAGDRKCSKVVYTPYSFWRRSLDGKDEPDFGKFITESDGDDDPNARRRKQDWNNDIAVLVFEPKSFQYYHPVNLNQTLAIDQQVLLVGFSPENVATVDEPKRWGRNIVTQNTPPADGVSMSDTLDNVYVSVGVFKSPSKVLIEGGDSGGPLLNLACELTGVASRGTFGRPRKNLHTQITYSTVQAFLRETTTASPGAKFCDTEMKSCNPAYRSVPITTKQPEEFPCRALAEASDEKLSEARLKLQKIRADRLSYLKEHIFACSDKETIARLEGQPGQCAKAALLTYANGKLGEECENVVLGRGGRVYSMSNIPYKARLGWDLVDFADGQSPSMSHDKQVNVNNWVPYCDKVNASLDGCCLEQKCYNVVDGKVSAQTECRQTDIARQFLVEQAWSAIRVPSKLF